MKISVRPVRLFWMLAAMAGLVGCGRSSPPSEQRASHGQACSGEAPAEGREKLQTASDRLFQIAGSDTGNPGREAKRAADADDFRFVGYSALVPGIVPAAYGVACRPDLSQDAQRAFVGPIFAASDVPASAADHRTEAVAAANYSRFGRAFNAALLADPRYPYRDICRAASPGHAPKPVAAGIRPQEYGFRDLAPTDRPIDLHEAARRGTADALRRLIKAGPAKVDVADPLGMTPLAWAVAYRRSEQAAILLEAGARPAGAICGDQIAPTAPIQIARAMEWRAMVEAMLPHVPAVQVAMLKDAPVLTPDNRLAVNAALAAIMKHHGDRLHSNAGRASHAILVVDRRGRAEGCKIEPATSPTDLGDDICQALRGGRWTPARALFGEAVRGEARMRIYFTGP